MTDTHWETEPPSLSSNIASARTRQRRSSGHGNYCEVFSSTGRTFKPPSRFWRMKATSTLSVLGEGQSV